MNCRPFRRSISIGVTLTIIVALLAFVVRAASAQGVVRRDTATLRLTLAEAVRLAAKQNASVEAARARIDAAQARVTERKADLLPNVSAIAAERGSTINSATFPIEFPVTPGQPALFDPRGSILGPVNSFDARARVSQTLYDPSVKTRIEAAKTSVAVAGADAASIADQVATATANAYLSILRADAVYTARLADSTLAAELLGIAEDQLKAGTGIALDVTRARSQIIGARSQLIIARNERERTRNDLSGILGMPPGSVEPTDVLASLPQVAAIDEAGVVQAAGRNRKDLQSLELQATAARQLAASIHGERLPTVSLVADEGLSQRNGRSYLPTYDWGIQLSLPVFDGHRREGRESEQIALARDLDIRSRDLRFQISTDVRSSTLNVRSAAEVVAATRERLSLAEQEVAQARERFQAGVSGNADVITASITLNNARTQLIDALISYQTSRVALARAQGSIATLD
ncbi:MAG: outer rane efflux protein [Gemmatimonadetes bacterium]|nr:outer rane efflux protein [Gemmatimonadota bacterium]